MHEGEERGKSVGSNEKNSRKIAKTSQGGGRGTFLDNYSYCYSCGQVSVQCVGRRYRRS